MRPTGTDVLLVVDVQRDFLPGGALAVPDGDAVVAPANRLGRLFSHVVLTQDWHPPGHASFATSHPGRQPFDSVALPYGPQVLWPEHCVQGTPGADFAPGLDLPHAELVIRKGCRPGIDSYSAFLEADRTTPTGLAATCASAVSPGWCCAASPPITASAGARWMPASRGFPSRWSRTRCAASTSAAR